MASQCIVAYGGPKLSRQKQKPHGKNKISLGKNKISHGKTKNIYQDPRQDSGQRNISYTSCFTQTYRDLYGDAMLVLTWMSFMADGNQQKHLLPSFATKA